MENTALAALRCRQRPFNSNGPQSINWGPFYFALAPSNRILRALMGIHSDQWIRQMAKEQGMIEPFADGQVRAAEDVAS